MKKLKLLLILSLLTVGQLFAQQDVYFAEEQEYKKARILKLNILSPVARTFTAAFESTINEESSLQFTFSLVSNFGYIITPEYRFYLSETPAPNGFYIAPFVRYMDFGSDGNRFGAGIVIGKQALFKEKITFDVFLGPAYNTFIIDEEWIRFGLRAGLTVGINLSRNK